jgi:Holliday junction resolvasome RuvABC endonuclease subunit
MALIDIFNNKIICIDNSTNSTAYAIFNGKMLEGYGEISFPGKDTYERLVQIRTSLEPLRKQCEKIADLYIEQTTFVQSQKTVILLGLAEGAVISSISHPGMRIHRISPLIWQKYIGNPLLTTAEKAEIKRNNLGKSTGWLKNEYRRIRKQKTMDHVNNKFNLAETNDNICDSIGLGCYISETR